jgi:hypothetical protein
MSKGKDGSSTEATTPPDLDTSAFLTTPSSGSQFSYIDPSAMARAASQLVTSTS